MQFTKDLSKLNQWELEEIERAKEVGLKFGGCGDLKNEEDSQSYIVYRWIWDGEEDAELWEKAQDFLTRDDDGQPAAKYIMYLGKEIWNFVVALS